MTKLLTVYDDKEPLNNVISALTIPVDAVFYIYHHEVSRNTFSNIEKVIRKYKDIQIDFIQLSEDEKQIKEILETDNGIIADVGGAKYLSLLLFDLTKNKDTRLIYYDDEENVIKDYRTHTVLYEEVFKLKIEDILKLRGGEIKEYMHQSISDAQSKKTIIDLVESNISDYPAFIRYMTRINSYTNNVRKIGNLSYQLDRETIQRIKTDGCYKKCGDLFVIEDDVLTFKNRKLKDTVCVSGAFLENYLYIKLRESELFDDVMMSAVIDFSDDKYKQPVRCEIDCLVIRNNHLLFVSCKSSKADTADLNEIYVHNSMFGNALSKPALCVGEELDRKYPSVYAKAEELGIYIIDRSSFIDRDVSEVFLSILNNDYQYDILPR